MAQFKILTDLGSAQKKRILMNNSLTFKVGDAIVPVPTANYTQICDNSVSGGSIASGSVRLLGIICGFSDANGGVLSTGQDPANTPNQVTTTATNTTVALKYAEYYPLTSEMELQGTLSAAAGTTTGSDYENTYFTLTDCRTINEASVSVYSTIGAMSSFPILSLGVIPGETTKIRCKAISTIY